MRGSELAGAGELSRLGYRLAAFHAWPLDESIKTLAGAGYKSVELCLEHPDTSPQKMTAKGIARVRAMLNDHGMRLSSVGHRVRSEDVAATLDKQRRGIEIAREFDCKILVVGTVPEAADPDGSKTSKALEELLIFAEGMGITVAVEPEPNTVINGMYEFSMLARRVAGTPLGLNLNVGHASLTEGNVIAVIQDWAPFIVHTHIEDIRRFEHVHLLPGDGHLDMNRLVVALREHNYDGDLTLDLTDMDEAPDQLAIKAMERCKEIFA